MQTGVCRAEAGGFFIFVCVEQGREGRQHPGTPDQHFIKICGDLGTDLLLKLFPQLFVYLFFIEPPGMLNVD